MEYTIYYFSGTGNSLYIANMLSHLLEKKNIETRIRSIPKMMLSTEKEITGSHIIIVFPSYLAPLCGMPVIVKEFTEQIPDIASKTITAVCSCGGYELVNAVVSVKFLAKIIKKQRGKLFNYFTLRMPMNNRDYDHIPIPIEKDEAIITRRAQKKLVQIAENIYRQKKFIIRKVLHNVFLASMERMFSFLKKASHRAMLDLAKEPAKSSKPMEEVLRLTDTSISADETCNGCGTCVTVCPVDNITLENKRPVWLHRCEMCFACHEWCPQKAVHHWGRKEGVYYHHPEISLKDIIAGRH